MGLLLREKIKKEEVVSFDITRITNDILKNKLIIRYNELDKNEKIIEGNVYIIEGKEEIKKINKRVATLITSGNSFEQASYRAFYDLLGIGFIQGV